MLSAKNIIEKKTISFLPSWHDYYSLENPGNMFPFLLSQRLKNKIFIKELSGSSIVELDFVFKMSQSSLTEQGSAPECFHTVTLLSYMSYGLVQDMVLVDSVLYEQILAFAELD